MNIGIVSPFNPLSISDMLNETPIPSANNNATAVNTLVREFLMQGHNVVIFTQYDHDSKFGCKILQGRRVKVYMVSRGLIPSLIHSERNFMLSLFYYSERLAKIIRKEIKNLDVIHAHWTYEFAVAASRFSSIIPVFVTVRDWCPYQYSIQKNFHNKVYWKINMWLFKKVMSDNRISLIANSSYTYKMLNKKYPNKYVPIIPNPIDKTWILSEKKYKNIHHKFISIAQNILDPRKNITVLLEAFSVYRKRYKAAELHLVGLYKEDSPMYLDWLNHHLLEDVYFHGVVDHNQLAGLLDTMSCLIHPSIEETFGNILLEAMSRCILCIGGYNSGAVGDVLGHGRYGIVCDINDSTSVFNAMVQMNDFQLYTKLISESLKKVLSTYASDKIVQKHICLFEARLKEK